MSVASGLHTVAEHTLCVGGVGVICDREVGGFHVNPLSELSEETLIQYGAGQHDRGGASRLNSDSVLFHCGENVSFMVVKGSASVWEAEILQRLSWREDERKGGREGGGGVMAAGGAAGPEPKHVRTFPLNLTDQTFISVRRRFSLLC